MGKYSNNNKIDNNSKSSQKVRSIDELLTAKRASNKLGSDRASEAAKKATDAVRGNAGKAKRSELRNDLVKSAQLAQAQGEEDGIKQFLSEDIPAVMNALNSELRSNHIASIEANEERLIESAVEGAVVDVEWSDYEAEYDMSFDTNEWDQAIEGKTEINLLTDGKKNNSEDRLSAHRADRAEANPFSSDDLPV
ncbi:MAG: hypothetical protein AAGE84_23395 [Cyanobacteria bacterium P01_G01_bin.39]